MADGDKKMKGGGLDPVPDPNHDSADPLPPPYDDGGAPAAAAASASASPTAGASDAPFAEPPNYLDVSNADPRTNLASSDPPTLILDGYTVHAESQPDRPLYELGLAPMTGRNGICGMEKIWYSAGADGGDPRQRKRFVYELQIWPPIDNMFGHVEIVGKSARSYKSIHLVGGAGWASCKAEGHFKAQTGWSQRLFKRGGGSAEDSGKDGKMLQIEWKDADGRVVAWEEFPAKVKDEHELARLNVQVVMEDKELDALVACWLSRVWRIRRSQTKEPLSWAMVKRRLAASPIKGGGIYSMPTNR